MTIFSNLCQVVDDDWTRYDRQQPIGRADRILVGVTDLARHGEFLQKTVFQLGVELEAKVAIEEIEGWLPRLDLVILNFDSFADGRAFSQARLLRQRFYYQGDIRAQGEVVRDQLAFMQQCGINQFDLGEEEGAALAFDSFTATNGTCQQQQRAG